MRNDTFYARYRYYLSEALEDEYLHKTYLVRFNMKASFNFYDVHLYSTCFHVYNLNFRNHTKAKREVGFSMKFLHRLSFKFSIISWPSFKDGIKVKGKEMNRICLLLNMMLLFSRKIENLY